jgi:flagellin
MAQADLTRIASNIAALNTLNSLRNINTKLSIAQLRLATGKRVNQAADDPAGLTIALKMNARNECLKVAFNNIGDAKNMLAVGEGGLQKMTDIITLMKAKCVQAASDTLGVSERAAIASELASLAQQIDDIVAETTWNGDILLNGLVAKTLQTGAESGETTVWTLAQPHDAVSLGVDAATLLVDSAANAALSITACDTALATVTGSMNDVGSLVARLNVKEETVAIGQVNTEAAYSRIMNADMAYEQVESTKYMILQQTAVAMLAQSNLGPQSILSLFR